MKKVLILCDYFPPHSGPRMGYLVKYLSRMGWESYVVAGELPSRGGFDALTGFAKEVHIIPQKLHRKWNLLHVLPFFWPYNYLHGEYDMLARARKIAQSQKFDIVLSSCTFGYSPNNVAWAISREFGLPLVVDIRDLAEQEPEVPFWKRSFSRKIDVLRSKCSFVSLMRSRRILQRADALVSVSPWHVQFLKDNYNANSRLIYNGFDPELFFAGNPVRTDRFEIVYTGTLGVKSLRDYTYLVAAVARLNANGIISPDKFRVRFFCGKIVNNAIVEDVRDKKLVQYFEFLPFVPVSQVPHIISRASVLLVLAKKGGFHGIMTTKFFEYLAVNRPVLCVESDEELLESAIRSTNAGCAARSVDDAYNFILEKFSEWRVSGYTRGTVSLKEITAYSRKEQARQFSELFNDTISHYNKRT